jgi:hypothetical protein
MCRCIILCVLYCVIPRKPNPVYESFHFPCLSPEYLFSFLYEATYFQRFPDHQRFLNLSELRCAFAFQSAGIHLSYLSILKIKV